MRSVWLRPYQPSDLAFLATCFGYAEELRHAIGDGGLKPFLQRMRSHAGEEFGCRIIVESDTGERVGLVYCEARDFPDSCRCLWIHLMLILPGKQRRGLGSDALKALLESAEGRVDRTLVSVSEANPEGLHFWEQNGFTLIRRVRLNEGGDGTALILYRN